jgi:hypothetical protein
MAADRRSSAILDVSSKAPAVRQEIRPEDFIRAFDNFLCPFSNNPSTVSKYCGLDGSNSGLTHSLWTQVYLAYSDAAAVSTDSIKALRNLFATSLYLFNPVAQGAITRSGANSLYTTQPGLPSENYFQGSFARTSTYVAPASWTVIAFVVSAAAFIFVAMVTILASLWFHPPEASSFAIVNAYRVVIDEPHSVQGIPLGDVMGDKPADKEIMQAAQGHRIRLYNPIGALSGDGA